MPRYPMIARSLVVLAGVTGEGAQCDDLAEGNEYIKSLQAKSALSKDKLNQETLDKYNDHNFKGEFIPAAASHMLDMRAATKNSAAQQAYFNRRCPGIQYPL